MKAGHARGRQDFSPPPFASFPAPKSFFHQVGSASPVRVPRTGAFHGRRVPSTRASLRREPSCNLGDVVEALERQVHVAVRIDMTGGVHRRIPSRADVPAGDQNRPMRVFVAITMLRSDIDRIETVVIMQAPCLNHACRGCSHENGGEET
jgi:hypothetical protein